MPEKRRMLSPEIRKDPELLKLSRDIRLFFSYLLMSADDAGNFDGDELKVKMETFPGDDDVTGEIVRIWLQELTKGNRKRGFVIPYCGDRDDGDRIYYHVRQFQKHQPIPHPTAPSYPLFPGQSYTYHRRDKSGKWENCTVTRPNCTRKCTRTVHVQYKKCPCSLTPERKLKEVKRKKDLKELRQPVDNSGELPFTDGADAGGNAEGHPPVAPPSGVTGNGVHPRVKALNLPPEKEQAVAGLYLRHQEDRIRGDDISEALRGAGLDHQEVLRVAQLFIG